MMEAGGRKKEVGPDRRMEGGRRSRRKDGRRKWDQVER
jgi:hypothetical protein